LKRSLIRMSLKMLSAQCSHLCTRYIYKYKTLSIDWRLKYADCCSNKQLQTPAKQEIFVCISWIMILDRFETSQGLSLSQSSLCELVLLKGPCHEIFCFWFFPWISFLQAPDYTFRAVSSFFKNSMGYSQLKVCHRCQRHRWHRILPTFLNNFKCAWRFFFRWLPNSWSSDWASVCWWSCGHAGCIGIQLI
jgi:hypothetical protein